MDSQYTVIPKDLFRFLHHFQKEATHIGASLKEDVMELIEDLLTSSYLRNAWRNSLLAYNGAPIEFTTSTFKPNELSCTIDPILKKGNQAYSLADFLPYFQKVSEWVDQEKFEQVEALQKGHSLKFGSWIGLKYGPKGKKVKVYSEIPDPILVNPPINRGSVEEDESIKNLKMDLLMIGYYPNHQKAGWEYYYQWPSAIIDFEAIHKIMKLFNWEEHFPKLQALIQNLLLFSPEPGKFPETTYGFSISTNGANQAIAFSFFTMTESFFGSNLRASLAIKRLLKHYQWEMPLFESILEQKLSVQHNVLGASITSEGQFGINCTFSPENKSFTESKISPPYYQTTKGTSFVEILKKYQLPNGAFTAQVLCPNGRSYLDANAFVTAQILRLLDDDNQTRPYVNKALDFLESCQGSNNAFTFWPTHQHPEWMQDERILPDIDDTAIVTEMLYKYKRIGLSKVQTALEEMSKYCLVKLHSNSANWLEKGVYKTWMNNRRQLNLVDCCANTNALVLFALTKSHKDLRYKAILRMLKKAVEWADNDYNKLINLIPYYAHPAEWLRTLQYVHETYFISELSPIIDSLSKKWNDLPTQEASPLYCRHDGNFLWTSSCLSALRRHFIETQN